MAPPVVVASIRFGSAARRELKITLLGL